MNKVILECKKCKYKWNYKGNLGIATCSNCGTKNNVKKQELEDKQDD